jgi:hypothetical protein
MMAADPVRRCPSAEAAEPLKEGAAGFHRQLVMGNLASEYDNDIRLGLEELKELDALMGQIQNIEEYNSLVEKFNELHKLALSRRDMLVIHREALKVFKHSYIDIFYPIPDKKRKKT